MSDAVLLSSIEEIGSAIDDVLDSSKSDIVRLGAMLEGTTSVVKKLERRVDALKTQLVSRVKSGDLDVSSADLAFDSACKMLAEARDEALALEKMRLMKEGAAAALVEAVKIVKKKYDSVEAETKKLSPAEVKLETSRRLRDLKSLGEAPSPRDLRVTK